MLGYLLGVVQQINRASRSFAKTGLGVPNIIKILDDVRAGPFFSIPANTAVPWRSTGNIFATKWVYIKHYGLKIGGPSFWWDSAFFLIRKIWKSPKWGSIFHGRVILEKKKAPARKLANSRPECGSTPRWSIHENPIQVLVIFSPGVKKLVSTNRVNWSCGLINPSGHLYFNCCVFSFFIKH